MSLRVVMTLPRAQSLIRHGRSANGLVQTAQAGVLVFTAPDFPAQRSVWPLVLLRPIKEECISDRQCIANDSESTNRSKPGARPSVACQLHPHSIPRDGLFPMECRVRWVSPQEHDGLLGPMLGSLTSDGFSVRRLLLHLLPRS